MPNIFAKTRLFWAETTAELHKASWPTFKELRASTGVILAVILLLGAFVALSDFSVYNWVSLFTRIIRGA
jgi:preprotein translocase subunit SecE